MLSLLNWDKWLIALAIFAASIFGSYQVGYWRGWNASEMHWKLEKEREVAAAKAEAAELKARGDTLAAELVQAKARVRVETVEVVREVIRYVRPKHEAIDGRITDSLNRMSGIRESSERAVSSTDGTLETDSASAPYPDRPSPGATSEKAITEWAITVIGMYEICRQAHGRLAELILSSAGKQQEK